MDVLVSLIVPMVLGFLTGRYLDGIFSLKFPAFTIIFTILGIITGMWSVYKRYAK